ncbi:TonB-dependent receptor [Hymenobacter properus]|uniref:TonB-dependent receptor n=1 Tax=Hymenobacter properus TaxID=2791026 RepID=A0A931FL04_9BACT|nr:TonB-dependent receptor [Hymenobacter properus]MBF9143638.1 TonB-dependent receptor [Hymenobacter properus]MBR7722451.1 TonB-dependent receptor [Microvirga sp. SRT04]
MRFCVELLNRRAGGLLVVLFLLLPLAGRAQSLTVILRDSLSQAPVIGGSVSVPGTGVGAATDVRGEAVLTPAPAAGTRLRVEALGYRTRLVAAPAAGTPLTLQLAASAQAIEEEVLVTATRTNSRLEDLPTRVEVIGEEELTEENGIKPGNIASLLGDLAGTQIQPTSPTTGNADLRIQGLPGRYSQILRDGLPLLGGYSGSFGILQIPPLDLRQIELIKGSSSTLYGGGAIAGLVNLVSKAPVLGTPQLTFTANQSTLKESNLNGFASGRNQRVGYTLFAGGTRQQSTDVDGDGFVDVPQLRNFMVHPRLFYYPKNGQLALGYTGTVENRQGGDVAVVQDQISTGVPKFFVTNRTQRHSADLIYTQDSLAGGSLTVKGTASWFRRGVSTNTVDYAARQLSYYSEVSYLHRYGHHTLVGGLNVLGEDFQPLPAASRTSLLNDYTYATVGGFVQDDWQLTPTLSVQGGLRLDHHNIYGNFLLPRAAVLFKASADFTLRLNGGYGYRVPVPYVNELDEREMPLVQPLRGLSAERSQGLNGDVNYLHRFASGLSLNLNQGFFYTRLQDPLVLSQPVIDYTNPLQYTEPLTWYNASAPTVSQGLESYARLRYDETEIYFGYLYTYARRQYDAANPNVPLAARHKLSTVATEELGEHLALGIEASYTGRQYLDDGSTRPGYPILAALVRYTTGPWTFILNGENLLDYRQTRREAVAFGNRANPVFPELWAPVEGRVFNLSVNWKLVRQ